ncbi:MAG: GNAT family N-acetyltransferase [Steroidobacteraceae bacterium]
MQRRRLSSIDEVGAAQWNALDTSGSPFTRHEFLAALERTGCVGGRTGWDPAHLLLSDDAGIAAAIPLYRKQHSWGEFVFDFGWAQAYTRHGHDYYPKLLAAIPFTPATGARLLVRADLDRSELAGQLIAALQSDVLEQGLSSAHVLFMTDAERDALEQAGWLLRRDCQFHWHNRGYSDFDAYLASFTAEKRKKAKRERRRIQEAGIEFLTLMGPELTPGQLDVVYAFHATTFARHGHEPYLSREFFTQIAATLGDALMVKLAMYGTTPVAASVFFRSRDTLFGRYWGASAEYHSLHFEACYHQGIEFCIEHGIARFEPGTQGEHKVSRGFEPTLTWSAHYLADPRFRDAVQGFLEREAPAVDAYAAQIDRHTPFRR